MKFHFGIQGFQRQTNRGNINLKLLLINIGKFLYYAREGLNYILFFFYHRFPSCLISPLELSKSDLEIHFWTESKVILIYKFSQLPSGRHSDNTPMQLNAIFHAFMNSIFIIICNMFIIYGPNIDCWCFQNRLSKRKRSVFVYKIR